MNKKFSTLMAGLLLAGGVFSVAEASNWTTDTRYVQNTGKYFLIQQSGRYTGPLGSGSWQKLPTRPTDKPFYLKKVGDKTQFVQDVQLGDKAAYWTIIIRQNSGQTEFQLKNMADGKPLQYKYTKSSGEEVTVEWFLSAYDGPERGSSASINVDVNTLYFYDDQNKAQYIYPKADTNGDWWVDANQITATSFGDGFNNIEIDEEAITAADLNAEWNGGFYLNFSSKGKEYKNLTGAEAFAGKLKAEGINGGSDTQFYLRTASGDYVILSDDYIGDADATLNGTKSAFYRGYNFKTISEHAFNQLTNKTVAQFSIFKSYDFNKDNIRTDSLIVSLPNVKAIGEVPNGGLNKSAANHESGLRLFVSTVNVAGVTSNLLTTIDYTKCNDMLADVKDNAYATAQMGALAPCINLGANNMIDWTAFAGKVWNITDKDGNVLTPNLYMADIDSYAEMFAPANQVDLTNPEGQWLLYKNNQTYYFVNRESGDRANFNYNGWTIRKTDTKDMYKLYWSKYSTGEEYTIYIREAKDAVLGKRSEKGYVNFDMAQEDNNGKYLSFETSLGVTAYIGKDADDNVILTDDASKAIEFRVKQLSHDFRDHDGIAAPDTLHHYTSYLDKDLKQAVDTLQFFHYALYENFSEKYLMYDAKAKKFKLSDDSYTYNAHERFDQERANYAFVVKEKEDGTYILVREYAIDYDYCNKENNHLIYNDWDGNKYTFDNTFEVNFGVNAFDSEKDYDVTGRMSTTTDDGYTYPYCADGQAHKVYLASQPGTLADMAALYNYNDNDRITMENTDKVEYLKITGSQDTVKISLKAQPNFFLYEQGKNGTNFLGMEHVADVKDMKAAILADTAYVRNNTFKPQYLLGVDTKIMKPIYDNAGHLLEPDTVYGRFLINAVDSANAWTGSVKTNPYIHEQLNGIPYYRLVFVDGYHTGDALTLHTGKADTKIALNNNNDKVCTFAFRYVDEAREGVKIETLYDVKADGTPVRGWLKYQNNVPVVTPDYEDAHVFLVDNTTTEAPTANEEISTSSVVVAGTNGAVVVKGAEGKNVIVSTILGKVVANEVVSSDNATIAAPAGIVVVSVDGESFKVVVK